VNLAFFIDRVHQTQFLHEVGELPAVSVRVFVFVISLLGVLKLKIPRHEVLLDRGSIESLPGTCEDFGVSFRFRSLLRRYQVRPVVRNGIEAIDCFAIDEEIIRPEVAIVNVKLKDGRTERHRQKSRRLPPFEETVGVEDSHRTIFVT
jgi:hypothetical protein